MSVRTTTRGPVLWVTIDRPEALNAIDYEVMTGLEEALELAEAVAELRVFVLTGAGTNCFISGGDLRKFHEIETRKGVEYMATRMRAILDRVEKLDCWTIACINGDAYGGGCETMLAFDFRIAVDTARLGFTQAKFHVPPGWGGATRLVEIVGKARALEWMALSSVIDADTAKKSGLIHRTEPEFALEEATQEWAEKLARNDRRLIKALKDAARRPARLSRDEAIEAELQPFCDLWVGEEHGRRIDAFLADDEG